MALFSINGINTKTFSLSLVSKKFKYSLGSIIKQSAFKHANAIIGIACRCGQDGNESYKNKAGITLANRSVMVNSILDLYSTNGTLILGNYSLEMLIADFQSQGSHANLVPPDLIQWNTSTITISPNTSITTGQQLEFTIWYTTDCAKSYNPNIAFNTGSYNVPKRRTVKVGGKVLRHKNLFLKFGSSELPNCAEIVGIRATNYKYVDNNGENRETEFYNSSFLKLKTLHSGYHSLLDNIPVTALIQPYYAEKNYFPIECTKAVNIDWFDSGIYIANDYDVNGYIEFYFTFWYY